MADTITTKTTRKLLANFADGNTTVITLADGNSSISAAQIADLETFMLDNQVILSQDGAAFTGLSVSDDTDTDTTLDLG